MTLALLLLVWSACRSPTGSTNEGDLPDEDTADFSLSVIPSQQMVEPGGSTHFQVDVAFLGDFSSNEIDLAVDGVPQGVDWSFAPDPLPHQGRSVLTLDADPSVTVGEYSLTVRVDAEGILHSQDVILQVTDVPNFGIGISPTTQNATAGSDAQYTVTLTSLNGFADEVTLSASGLPAGAAASFSPNPVIPSASSTLVVSTSESTPTGEHDFSVTGTSGSLAHEVVAVVNVSATAGSSWVVSSIGSTGAQNNCVRVGPARNDGIGRVYVGTVTTGRIFEFSRTGTSWDGVDIGGSPSGQEIHNMGIGPGRNDGVVRLYAGSIDGNLYELSYNGSEWDQTTVGSSGGPVFHAVVGDVRGDGIHRVYSGRGSQLWEHTWTGSGWDGAQLGTVSGGQAHGLALGDGRGDGQTRVYIASTGSGVYEATYSSGSWSLENVAATGDTRNVNFGVGRNDGQPRVYAARADGVMTEVTWTGSGWAAAAMNSSVGSELVHAYVLDGRRDGSQRVYSASGNGNVYEFTWTGSGWMIGNLGGASTYMYGLHSGEAQDDGLVRLYGSSFDMDVYEFTWQ